MTIDEELEYLQQLKENREIDENVLYKGSLPPYLRLHTYKMLKANNLTPVLEEPKPQEAQEPIESVRVKAKTKRKQAEKAAKII